MIVIVGKSASGKTTLVKKFIEKHPEYQRVVTYTTRPIRDGEVDGEDYHFIPQATFDAFLERDFFIEHAEYRGWYYGTAKVDCESENAIAVLTPSGLRALRREGINPLAIYLYVDRRSCLVNILLRGDDIDEAYRRNLSDHGQFDQVESEVDYVIDNTGFHMNEDEAVLCLEEIIKTHKGKKE